VSALDTRDVAAVLRTVLQIEAKHRGTLRQDENEHAMFTPWMPFQPFRFIAMAAEAVPEISFPPDPAARPRFFEIGAGPGTKMLIAREMFGFDVHGIEYYDEYAVTGRALGLDVVTGDAGAITAYDGYALIWFNRCFRDSQAQRLLERRVWECASPGTVIMCANLEDRPPMSWYPVLDEWDDARAGIWQKPFESAVS
jgi:hypothetical protein